MARTQFRLHRVGIGSTACAIVSPAVRSSTANQEAHEAIRRDVEFYRERITEIEAEGAAAA
jgi:hypothetical protein